MEINGKVYRNLEGQVGYLTDKYDDLQNQINDVRAHLTHYVEVDQLPTGDDIDPSAVYLLGPMGTAPDQYYEEWVYVQKADESWIWEKLGDTDSVDLSGYLEKDTTSSTYPKVYVKWGDGTQGMENLTQDNTYNAVVRRKADGRITVPAPSADGDCANKKYVDDGFVAKQTGTSASWRVYGVDADGVQGMLDARNDGAYAYSIAIRDAQGRIYVGTPAADAHATTKKYVDDNFLAKQTGVTSTSQVYYKAADGTQGMWNMSSGATGGSIAVRNSTGQLVCETPTSANHAANKAYVDAAVGQLLYLHDIEIIVTVDATNKLYIKAYLINGSATAITAIDRSTFKRMDVQYGAFGPDLANVNTCAVTKCPDSLRQDEFDEPFPAYLYQYISGGSLVSGQTTYAMTVTVTDTVISF